jgi:uncharacterized membrane protein
MPLNRATITVASRVMLPTYPILAAGVGLNYLIASDRLLDAGVFYQVADSIVPLEFWGAAFLLVAIVMVVALLTRSRLGYELSLALMAGAMLVWATVGLLAAIHNGGSYTAALWPGFVIMACVASFMSLNEREL